MNNLTVIEDLDLMLSGKAERTKVEYKRSIAQFQDWLGGRQFTVKLFAAWIAELSETQSVNTVRKKRAAIVWLAEAIKNEAFATYDENPERARSLEMRHLAVQSVKVKKVLGTKLGKWLTQDEAGILLKEATGEELLPIALMIGCGLRVGELYKLTGEMIQERDGRCVIVDLEHKGRVRSIPVPEWVCELFEDTTGKIIPAAREERSKNEGSFRKIISRKVKRALARAGFEGYVNHDLRRTAARLWYENGGDIYQISMILGHASVAQTAEYIGAALKIKDSAVDKVSFVI